MVNAYQFHGSIMMNTKKGRIDGLTGKNLLSSFSESPGGEREGRDKAAEVNDFFFGASVSDSFLEIFLEGFDEGRVWNGIPKDPVVDASVDGVDNFGWRGEIHVSDPEGVEIATAVPFERARSMSGDRSVEIRHERMMEKLWRGPITKGAKIRKLG
jgi:hypothetical protein